MIKLYAWNVGWVMGLRKDGTVAYTKHKAGAKPYTGMWDKELIEVARMIYDEGHHIDFVHCK